MEPTRDGVPFVPSALTFAIVVFALLWCTVIGGLSRWPGPLEARLESREDAHPKELGEDLSAPYRAAKRLMNGQPVYQPATPRYPVYDYIPQSLLVAWPLAALFRFKSGYYCLILLCSSALYLLLMTSALRSWRPGFHHYAVMFPVFMFLSEGGTLLYNRGNLDALPAVAGAAAFLCVLTRRDRTAALCFALMTCVKPIYVPFAAFLLLFSERWRMAAVYAGVHLLACAALVLHYGSLSIITDYFRYLPGYVSYMKNWAGGYNISFPSTLTMQFPALLPELMSLEASLAVLAVATIAGLLVAFRGRRTDPPERGALPVYFLYFAYVCLLWQCASMMYGSLILLPAIPSLDRLYRASASRRLRLGLLVHAVLLGIVLTPYVALAPFREKGPFYFLAFLAAGWVLISSRTSGGEACEAPRSPAPEAASA